MWKGRHRCSDSVNMQLTDTATGSEGVQEKKKKYNSRVSG